MKQLAFDPMTVLSRLENLYDSVTNEKKPLWPGDFVVSPVTALSIAPMGVTTPWKRMGNKLKVEQLGFRLFSRLLASFLWLAVHTSGGLGMIRVLDGTWECDWYVLITALHNFLPDMGVKSE